MPLISGGIITLSSTEPLPTDDPSTSESTSTSSSSVATSSGSSVLASSSSSSSSSSTATSPAVSPLSETTALATSSSSSSSSSYTTEQIPSSTLSSTSSGTTLVTSERVSNSTFSTSSSTLMTSSTSLSSTSLAASSPTSTSASSDSSSSSSSSSTTVAQTTSSSSTTATGSVDMFKAIATDAPPSMFTRLSAHPLQPTGFSSSIIKNSTIPTNNFYTNLYLDNRDQPAYPYPYSVWWNQGTNSDYGLGISHTTSSQFTFGPDSSADPVEYFVSPIGIRSMSLSAAEFGSSMTMNLTNPLEMSVDITLAPSSSSSSSLVIPLVQGTGFITGVYKNLTPMFNSQVSYTSLTKSTSPRTNVVKYVAALSDGTSWGIYATLADSSQSFELTLTNSTSVTAGKSYSSIVVQIAKIVSGQESVYDDHAGMYATKASLSGSAVNGKGYVTITWATAGSNNADALMLFALPHHASSFSSSTSAKSLGFTLDALTKGTATAYSTSTFEFVETLPDINFAPWTSISGKSANYTSSALGLITKAAVAELKQDVVSMTDLDSMYSSGKILGKFAMICYTVHGILGNTALTKTCLANLKEAFARFSSNSQTYPLYYDETYKGLISSGAISTGDSLTDYGNSYYNDHHFHYGYHIHAAAVIGYVDSALGGTWASDNKEYVNSLVRDVANPSHDDTYFPVSRSFSWYHGHSWAKGLFSAADGKDQESSSEDVHHAYGIKMWGSVVGDSSMEARGAMMLALMKRSMNDYILMASDNTIQPSNFIGNKAVGIIFENKADHTTFFGTNEEYIEGIHMLPLTPVSSYIRTPTFVSEEWESKLASLAPTLTDGWRGILYSNLGLTDPESAYEFFTGSDYSSDYLDGGASLTWYLAYLAGVYSFFSSCIL
ncbi:glycosyl hydrolase family 81-domain-containing protein [Myxozyma melibiosi]|uniref:glucan endo-1,3-beta-D-glucosidase n=1 Tax=Myxozyma melibiosi TaxID=54550 RepID=A0ABR1F3D3_9ASCO